MILLRGRSAFLKPNKSWPPQVGSNGQLSSLSRRYATHQPARLTQNIWSPSVKLVTGVVAGSCLLLLASHNAREKINHGISAAERSGRVFTTLAICIYDYRQALRLPRDDEDHWQENLKACHKKCAERTLRAMEKNGSIFIKLGQHLSSLNYLLPLEWTSTFIPLQDHCPVSSYESIERMFLRDTGKPLEYMFTEFGKEPIGAASLAQVHLATLKSTQEKVAIKVQHPILEEWIPLDLSLTKLSFSWLKYFFPKYDLDWLSSEMESSLSQELNFAMEGRYAMQTKRYFESLPRTPLVVPNVIWSSRRILVMEYLAGHRPDDLKYLDANSIDRDEVSAALARIFNEMIFGNTILHCDPHGGNIAIRKNERRWGHNFDIILYDHGLYRDIPKQLRRDYAKLWLAVIDSDEEEMRKYCHRVAGIGDEDFPLFASAITGRDYLTVQDSVISTRTDEEKQKMSHALGDGLLENLVQILAKVPPIILLILKTNDLTRSLDENLHTRMGPIRNFMILAQYCSKTVFEEEMEIIRDEGGLFYPWNALRLFRAWSKFLQVRLKLSFYEWSIAFKHLMTFRTIKQDAS